MAEAKQPAVAAKDTAPSIPVPVAEAPAAAEAEAPPAEETLEDNGTYYLKPGKHHNVCIKGETREITVEGTEVKFTPEQYNSFRDKFWTKGEYELAKTQGNVASGNTAADVALKDSLGEGEKEAETK